MLKIPIVKCREISGSTLRELLVGECRLETEEEGAEGIVYCMGARSVSWGAACVLVRGMLHCEQAGRLVQP